MYDTFGRDNNYDATAPGHPPLYLLTHSYTSATNKMFVLTLPITHLPPPPPLFPPFSFIYPVSPQCMMSP